MTFAFDLDRPLAAIVLGRAGIDLYPLPDGTKTESAEQFAAGVGGSAGNMAVARARQGYRTALLGALTDDTSRMRFALTRTLRAAVMPWSGMTKNSR